LDGGSVGGLRGDSVGGLRCDSFGGLRGDSVEGPRSGCGGGVGIESFRLHRGQSADVPALRELTLSF
jgi:hypothetical protein